MLEEEPCLETWPPGDNNALNALLRQRKLLWRLRTHCRPIALWKGIQVGKLSRMWPRVHTAPLQQRQDQNEPDRAARVLVQGALRHVPFQTLPVVIREKYHSHLGCHSSETDADDSKKVRLSSDADAVLIRDSGA